MNGYVISKKNSNAMKGIAILLMLFHHMFTFGDWIQYGRYEINEQIVMFLSVPTRVCVAIFAFITGWAYVFLKQTIKASVEKILKFYFMYIVAFIILTAVCVFYDNTFLPSGGDFILEAIGIKYNIMVFCWYVPFYIITMLTLPYLRKFFDKSFVWAVVVGILLPIVIGTILKTIIPIYELAKIANDFRHWFPVVSVGYICNKYNIFGLVKKQISRINEIVIGIICILFVMVSRYYISEVDFIYGPVLCFGLNEILDKIKSSRILEWLGKISTNIWFLHCAAFCIPLNSLFQPLIYCSRIGILCFIVGIIFFSLCAFALTSLEKLILKRVSKKYVQK